MKLSTLLVLAATLTAAAFAQTSRAEQVTDSVTDSGRQLLGKIAQSDVPDNMLSLLSAEKNIGMNNRSGDAVTFQLVQDGKVVRQETAYFNYFVMMNVDFAKAKQTMVRALVNEKMVDEVEIDSRISRVSCEYGGRLYVD
mgnify:CR=1 FL=1